MTFQTTTTSLTMIETLNLIETLQISSTYDNIVKVSGQDATDVARSLAANLNKLTVSSGTYVLQHTTAAKDALRAQGKLAERMVLLNAADPNSQNSYMAVIVVQNASANGISSDDFTTAYDNYENALIAADSTHVGPVLRTSGAAGEFLLADSFTFWTSIVPDTFGSTDPAVVGIPSQIAEAVAVCEQFGIVFEDDVTVLESQWIKPVGSLI